MNHGDMEELIGYLEMKYDKILDRWKTQINVLPDDPNFHLVVEHTSKTFKLLTLYVKHSDQTHIVRHTKKIAKKRIAADTNLEVLVNYINIGRAIVFDEIAHFDFRDPVKANWMIEISGFFDLFLYHITSAYNELKESIINDKNQFIRQMHADRLTILGQIAASFAHEFRNPLTSIKGFLALIQKRLQMDTKSEYYFSIINREMASLEEKVTQFLFFSKSNGLNEQVETVQLNQLLNETVEFLYPRFLSEGIEVDVEIESVEMIAEGVNEQLKQVFLNILNNAVEELSLLQDRKKICLSAEIIGDRIFVCIANNGQKIEAQLLDNIFEPFISTKELGTGLGLAVCKQIIEKHEGKIKVTSTEKKTMFQVELPLKKI